MWSCSIIIIFSAWFSVVRQGSAAGLQDDSLVHRIGQAVVHGGSLLSLRCTQDLKIFLERLDDVQSADLWPFEMLDASSKVPVGLMSYNYADLGHFDECIKIESTKDGIKGKYCLGYIDLNSSAVDFYSPQLTNKHLQDFATILEGGIKLNGNPTWSMCVPSSCSDEDTMLLMSEMQLSGFSIDSANCQTAEDVYPTLTSTGIFGILFLSILLIIILVSTVYDLFTQNNTNVNPGLVAFSVYTNGRSLFRIPQRTSSLSCLDGIKVLSMVWIYSIHTYKIYTIGAVFNPIDIFTYQKSIFIMLILNAGLACDAFLLVGGTLVTYVYFRKFNGKNMSIPDILKHYLHRFLRLAPPLAGLVLTTATVLRYLGSGPKWPYVINTFEGTCQKYWWSTLLFIQNEVNVNKLCVGHTWYLSIDMQLYLLSPLIFWILSRHSKIGITCLIVTTAASATLAFFRAYYNDLASVTSNFNMKSSTVNVDYYKTETRAAPWLIGALLGYILTKKQFKDISLPKKVTFPIWILSFTVILLCVLGGSDSMRTVENYNLETSFYVAMVRPSFALAISWIIWACYSNNGGIINQLLSLKLFQFMNQFIYSMYLVHVSTLFIIVFSNKAAPYINLFSLAYWFWSFFMVTFGLSILWVLAFEKPILNLEKLIFHPKTQKPAIKTDEPPKLTSLTVLPVWSEDDCDKKVIK